MLYVCIFIPAVCSLMLPSWPQSQRARPGTGCCRPVRHRHLSCSRCGSDLCRVGDLVHGLAPRRAGSSHTTAAAPFCVAALRRPGGWPQGKAGSRRCVAAAHCPVLLPPAGKVGGQRPTAAACRCRHWRRQPAGGPSRRTAGWRWCEAAQTSPACARLTRCPTALANSSTSHTSS